MKALFLSASIPLPGRGDYFDTADPFLIQIAIRELITLVLGRQTLVWGGHPAITPMVWAVCEDLGVNYADAVVLYQSLLFEDIFPEDNRHFGNVHYVDKIEKDKEASLLRMRTEMLSRPDLEVADFIAGMEGIVAEHALFRQFHPGARVIAVPAPGGAARTLFTSLNENYEESTLYDVDFATLFYDQLQVQPNDNRTKGEA
jgi:hypothetical protein